MFERRQALKLTARFFAIYRERVGLSELTLDLPIGTTVSDFLEALRQRYPDLASPTVNIVVAVNTEYAGENTTLFEGDEVALIPPVSGGHL